MPHVDVGGLSVYYEVHGQGDPLVLILGLALDVSEVQGLVEGLAAHFKVIVLDNRGAGRTDQPPGPYSIPMMADDALGLLDALAIRNARIVGISMGARIALDISIRHPERVRELIIVGAQYKQRGKWHKSLPMKLMWALRWLPIGKSGHPQSREAFEAQKIASMSYDCEEGLSSIGARTLVLHGARDRTAPLQQAEEISKRIPNATLRTFRGGHLFFMMGERRESIDAVCRFRT